MIRKIRAVYILFSYVLVLPLAVFGLFSRLFMVDDLQYWDKQAEAIVITCTDVTHHTKGEYENGGPSLTYEAEAVFDVEGHTYLVKTTGGTNYKAGSKVIISYNSEDPEKNNWSSDPTAENDRMKKSFQISGILFLIAVFGCFLGFRDRKRNKKAVS